MRLIRLLSAGWKYNVPQIDFLVTGPKIKMVKLLVEPIMCVIAYPCNVNMQPTESTSSDSIPCPKPHQERYTNA